MINQIYPVERFEKRLPQLFDFRRFPVKEKDLMVNALIEAFKGEIISDKYTDIFNKEVA